MLAMDIRLMGVMETPHLLAALEAEGPLTPAEIILSWRLDAADEEAQTLRGAAEAQDKSYESAMEQSEFRAQLIQEILDLCDAGGTRKELVAAIKSAVENSYVEL